MVKVPTMHVVLPWFTLAVAPDYSFLHVRPCEAGSWLSHPRGSRPGCGSCCDLCPCASVEGVNQQMHQSVIFCLSQMESVIS